MEHGDAFLVLVHSDIINQKIRRLQHEPQINGDGVGPSQLRPIRFWTRSRPPSSVSGPPSQPPPSVSGPPSSLPHPFLDPPPLPHPFLDPLPASAIRFWTPSRSPSSVSRSPPSLRHPFLDPLPVSPIRFWNPLPASPILSGPPPGPPRSFSGPPSGLLQPGREGCPPSFAHRNNTDGGGNCPACLTSVSMDGFDPPHLRPVGVPPFLDPPPQPPHRRWGKSVSPPSQSEIHGWGRKLNEGRDIISRIPCNQRVLCQILFPIHPTRSENAISAMSRSTQSVLDWQGRPGHFCRYSWHDWGRAISRLACSPPCPDWRDCFWHSWSGASCRTRRRIVPWFSLSRLMVLSSYAVTGLVTLLIPRSTWRCLHPGHLGNRHPPPDGAFGMFQRGDERGGRQGRPLQPAQPALGHPGTDQLCRHLRGDQIP